MARLIAHYVKCKCEPFIPDEIRVYCLRCKGARAFSCVAG